MAVTDSSSNFIIAILVSAGFVLIVMVSGHLFNRVRRADSIEFASRQLAQRRKGIFVLRRPPKIWEVAMGVDWNKKGMCSFLENREQNGKEDDESEKMSTTGPESLPVDDLFLLPVSASLMSVDTPTLSTSSSGSSNQPGPSSSSPSTGTSSPLPTPSTPSSVLSLANKSSKAASNAAGTAASPLTTPSHNLQLSFLILQPNEHYHDQQPNAKNDEDDDGPEQELPFGLEIGVMRVELSTQKFVDELDRLRAAEGEGEQEGDVYIPARYVPRGI